MITNMPKGAVQKERAKAVEEKIDMIVSGMKKMAEEIEILYTEVATLKATSFNGINLDGGKPIISDNTLECKTFEGEKIGEFLHGEKPVEISGNTIEGTIIGEPGKGPDIFENDDPVPIIKDEVIEPEPAEHVTEDGVDLKDGDIAQTGSEPGSAIQPEPIKEGPQDN